MDEAIQSHPIHTMQQGFRNDRNTETVVSEVADYIEKNKRINLLLQYF